MPDAQSASKPTRLLSLDTYRGLIMVTLVSTGFGLRATAQNFKDDPLWQAIDFHFEHPEWLSQFNWIIAGWKIPTAVSYWDMIQPSFMFMVGVSMPYSYGRRKAEGEPAVKQFLHVIWRSLILIILGVLLTTPAKDKSTQWQFTNVLCQIGLGYWAVYLFMGRKLAMQIGACALILIATWAAYFFHPIPGADFDFKSVGVDKSWLQTMPGLDWTMPAYWAHWMKGANVGMAVDQWLLNLFPREKPFVFNPGGYPTINFIPSIVTMALGLMAGETLRSTARSSAGKVTWLYTAGLVCVLLGVILGVSVCPVIKKLWTPSWAMLAGGYALWILATLYLVIDVIGLRFWTFPLIVIGMNSILVYVIDMTLKSWIASGLQKHISPTLFDGDYGPMKKSACVLAAVWLFCVWMHRQKAFIRI